MKPGYKHTEVGVIPEDWEVSPLAGKVSISHGFAFSSEHFSSHGHYKLTTPGHFHEAGGFRDVGEKQKFYVGPVPQDFVFAKFDLAVAMTEQADGLLGSAARIPSDDYLHNQRLGRVNASAEISREFLFYVFNSPRYRAGVRETAVGTKVKHTSPQKLLEISVPIPPLPEQRAIAEALSDVDGLLGGLDRLIAKKRDLKQAAMQQLLTAQTRLPGFHGEWRTQRLGDLSEMSSGGTPPSSNPDYYDGDVPWVSISDMTKAGKFISSTDRNLTREGLANSAAKIFPVGTILYAMYASIGECSIAAIPVSTSQAILGIRTKASLNSDFLYYYLNSLKPVVKSLGQQGTQANLNKGMVEDFTLKLPPPAEQTAIAEVLGEMDGELAALEARREKTRALKQAMMHALLTGQVRLV